MHKQGVLNRRYSHRAKSTGTKISWNIQSSKRIFPVFTFLLQLALTDANVRACGRPEHSANENGLRDAEAIIWWTLVRKTIKNPSQRPKYIFIYYVCIHVDRSAGGAQTSTSSCCKLKDETATSDYRHSERGGKLSERQKQKKNCTTKTLSLIHI